MGDDYRAVFLRTLADVGMRPWEELLAVTRKDPDAPQNHSEHDARHAFLARGAPSAAVGAPEGSSDAQWGSMGTVFHSCIISEHREAPTGRIDFSLKGSIPAQVVLQTIDITP
jgi:hypothetical protein